MSDARLSTTLDWIERLTVLALYGFLAARVAAAFLDDGNPYTLLLLVSEGLVVVFVLIRRPARAISQRPRDWALALAATSLPLLVGPAPGLALVPAAVYGGLLVAGILVQIIAKLTLRRSFGLVAAHRGLVTRGPYRLVRHPIYLGYMISQVGFLLLVPTWWNLGIYALSFGLQVARIHAEERLLRDDPDYRAFTQAVPSRLIPGLY